MHSTNHPIPTEIKTKNYKVKHFNFAKVDAFNLKNTELLLLPQTPKSIKTLNRND